MQKVGHKVSTEHYLFDLTVEEAMDYIHNIVEASNLSDLLEPILSCLRPLHLT